MIQPPVRTQSRVARALAGLPPRVQAKLSGRAPITIDGQRLDPEVQLLLSLRSVIGEPVWDHRLSPARARELAREESAMARRRTSTSRSIRWTARGSPPKGARTPSR